MKKIIAILILTALSFQTYASDNDGIGGSSPQNDNNIICQLFAIGCTTPTPKETKPEKTDNQKSDNDGIG